METDLVDVLRFLGTRSIRLSQRRTHTHDAIHSHADSTERDGVVRPVGLAISLVYRCVDRRALAQGTLSIEPWARRAAVPAVVIAFFCFIIRRMVAHGLELRGFEFLFDKWHLGPLRMLDFAAVAALLIVSQPITKQAAIRPLVLLGQSSLQVFCVHLLFCLAGLTLLGNASMLSGLKQIALLTMTFTAMLITALMFSRREAKNELQRNHNSPADQVHHG